MNDIIKDPIQPGVTPTPTAPKSSNTGLIIAIVVICVVFILPMAFMLMILGFFRGLVDDLDEFDLYYDEPTNGAYHSYKLSEKETKSFQSVWMATQDEAIAKRGIGYDDCMSIVGSSWGFYHSNTDVFDDFIWRDDTVCNEILRAKSTIIEENNVLYISDGKSCSSYTLSEDFSKILEFSKYLDAENPCVDMVQIPLIIGAEDEDEDEDDAEDWNESSDAGSTQTNRT